jgi:protein gp37
MIPDGECYQEDFHYPPELVKDGRRFCPVCLEERAKERQVEPTRQRVFCASMADVFEDNPQVMDWRAELFEMIEATPNLDWLLLTKRPEKIRELGALAVVQPFNHWLVTHKNVWIGTSIETQAEADKRTKALLNVGPCIRFLSAGPLLEEITIPDIKKWDMVIVEGESGPNCRPFEWDWARKIYEECRAYGVMFFMKQGGGHPNKRDKLEDIPYDLRIREFPK